MVVKRRLNVLENPEDDPRHHAKLVVRIIQNSPASLYAVIRFAILPVHFLLALAQHMPEEGVVVDLGCGYGLTTTFFALLKPQTSFYGLDFNESRIKAAQELAQRLGVTNVVFASMDLSSEPVLTQIDVACCIDLFHHITPESGNSLLEVIYSRLKPGGKILLKDIDTHPRLGLQFTFWLDLLMCPRDSFFYRSTTVWCTRLAQVGFRSVSAYPLANFLPFPHILLVGTV